MKKILVVGVNWLGDSVFSLPFLENLDKNYPNSHIGVVAPQYLCEVFEASPYVKAFYGLSGKALWSNPVQ